MARTCPLCNFNFDTHGSPGSDRHRCLGGKMADARAATQLEKQLIAEGKLDPSVLLPKNEPRASAAGRLAPRTPSGVGAAIIPQPRTAQQPRDEPVCVSILRDVKASLDRIEALLDKR